MDEKILVKEFFDNYSNNYDEDNKKGYWRLCDETLMFHLRKRIDKDSFDFVELGSGTGEWSKKIFDEYPNSKGRLYDISDGMLAISEQKLRDYSDRVQINKQDIVKISGKQDADYTFLIYVLMFTKEQEAVLRAAKSTLKKDGKLLFVVENQLNGIAVNLLNDNSDEAIKIYNESFGTITEKVPQIYYNTVEDIKSICDRLGMEITYYAGFPVATTVGVKRASDSRYRKMKDILSDERTYKEFLSIEKELTQKEEMALRGKYILFEAMIKNGRHD